MSADITEERITEIVEEWSKGPAKSPTVQVILALYAQRNEARSQLAALQPVPQGVEVPELLDADAVWQDAAFLGKEYSAGLRDGYDIARKRARLAPTPPQAPGQRGEG